MSNGTLFWRKKGNHSLLRIFQFVYEQNGPFNKSDYSDKNNAHEKSNLIYGLTLIKVCVSAFPEKRIE